MSCTRDELERFIKDPDSKLDYRLDWSKWLGSDTISTSSWSLAPADSVLSVSVSPAASIDSAALRTTVWLEGGTVGIEYRVTNQIQTVAGRIADRSFLLMIEER